MNSQTTMSPGSSNIAMQLRNPRNENTIEASATQRATRQRVSTQAGRVRVSPTASVGEFTSKGESGMCSFLFIFNKEKKIFYERGMICR